MIAASKKSPRFLLTMKVYENGKSPSYEEFRKPLDENECAIVSTKLLGEDIYCTLFKYEENDADKLREFFANFQPSRIFYSGEIVYLADRNKIKRFSSKRIIYIFMQIPKQNFDRIGDTIVPILDNVVFATEIEYPSHTSFPVPLLYPIRLYNFVCVIGVENLEIGDKIIEKLKANFQPIYCCSLLGVKHGWHTKNLPKRKRKNIEEKLKKIEEEKEIDWNELSSSTEWGHSIGA